MNAMRKGWFSEVNDMWPGICLSLEIEKVFHSEKSQYQDILLVETKSHGKALILDGILQCTESDEFSYQEMISYLALCSHPHPRSVLIVGGGDGGVAREVAKEKLVEMIDQVEIDGRVVELCKQYLPSMAVGYKSDKVRLYIDDGLKFLEKGEAKYDVIITDSSDPIGPATGLFEMGYFAKLEKALKPDGIIISQAGSAWSNLERAAETFRECQKVFDNVAYAITSVPTYPSGQIGFVIGSNNPMTVFNKPLRKLSEEDLESMAMRYYTPEIHEAAFVLPRSFKNHFSKCQS